MMEKIDAGRGRPPFSQIELRSGGVRIATDPSKSFTTDPPPADKPDEGFKGFPTARRLTPRIAN